MASMIETMHDIDTAMAGCGYAMLTLSASKSMLKKGYVEINHDITNDDSQFATRLTATGSEYLYSNNEPAISAAPNKKEIKMSVYTPLQGIPKPEKTPTVRKSGGGRKSKYDFPALNIGDMFFVPNADVRSGDAFKTLSSAVAMAHINFSVATEETRVNRKGETVPVMIREREFSVRGIALDGIDGAGVWRDK